MHFLFHAPFKTPVDAGGRRTETWKGVYVWGYKDAADPEWALHAIKDIKQHCKNVFMTENLQVLYIFLRASLSQ